MQGPNEGHVCGDCFLQLERDYRTLYWTKKYEMLRTQKQAKATSKKYIKLKQTIRKKPTSRKCEKIYTACKQSKYYTALRWILASGKAAKRAFLSLVGYAVRSELKEYKKKPCSFPIFGTDQLLKDYPWKDVLSTLAVDIPTLYSALLGAMPRKKCFTEEHFKYVLLLTACTCK